MLGKVLGSLGSGCAAWELGEATQLRARGLDHSPVPLLTKPFTNEQLVAMVRSVLDVSAAS